MKWAVLLITAVTMSAQKAREFEVATLKAANPEGQTILVNLGRFLNGKVELGNATLADCLKFAYSLNADAELEGPDWIDGRGAPRFDIVGQAPANASRDEALLMLQSLLAERLKLEAHRAPRERSYLALVEDRAGRKMREASPAATAQPINGQGHIQNPRMMMQTLSMLLSRFERQAIMDRTNLTGFWDVKLDWIPESVRNTPPRPDGQPIQVNGQAIDLSGPALSTALREQLGLRLESRKGPIDVLIVDRVDKVPAPN